MTVQSKIEPGTLWDGELPIPDEWQLDLKRHTGVY